MRKNMEEKIDKLAQLLRKRGLKLTPQRMVIFNILSRSEEHLTADEVYQKAKKIYPMLSATTVYRNLEDMVGAGLLSHFKHSGSAMRYDTNIEEHHHFICNECGKVKDIYLKGINYDVDKQKSFPENFRVDGSELYLYGVCGECLSA